MGGSDGRLLLYKYTGGTNGRAACLEREKQPSLFVGVHGDVSVGAAWSVGSVCSAHRWDL